MPERRAPIPVYFTSLEIENVRCFGDKQTLDLTSTDGQPAQWTLILGDNGVGKTTLLQCLTWMRLVLIPEGDSQSGTEADDELGELLPLAEGNLGPALAEEEDPTLESLLRLDSGSSLRLSATLSAGSALSPIGENAKKENKKKAGRPKTVEARAQLDFDTRRHLSNFDRKGPTIETDLKGEFHEPVVVAYGANRHRGVKNLAKGDLDDPTAASRFTGLTELYDVEEILSHLDYASKTKGPTSREHTQLERLREALARILPGDDFKSTDIEILPPDVLDSGGPSGVCLKTFSGLVPIPMSALSLGYRTTLALAADLAWRLLKRYPGSPAPLAEPAVVLIDEIDLHLHPRWQLGIIEDLSAIFPGTQFVATSHSPLVVQVAEAANFVLLRKREKDVEIVNEPEVVRRWRVDQILTSELFEVPGARNKQTELLFTRRDELVEKGSLSAEEEAELESLRVQISELPTAQDPEDQKAMDLIRKAAALLKKHRVVGQ